MQRFFWSLSLTRTLLHPGAARYYREAGKLQAGCRDATFFWSPSLTRTLLHPGAARYYREAGKL